MSTLLTICTRVLDEIGSFDVPTFIVDNTDDTAKQLLAFAKKVGEELIRDYDWQELSKTATVTTVPSDPSYALPADYERIASDTMWDANSRRMRGQTTKRLWSAITTAQVPTASSYFWRLHGGLIHVYPTPSSVFDFTYEYLSSYYCQTDVGTPLAAWMSDTDTPLLPADIFINGVKYYFSKANNLPYGDAEAEYDWVIQSRQSRNTPSAAVDLGAGSRQSNRSGPLLNIPDRVDA